MGKNRDNFTEKTVRRLAERAAYLCSNPSCHRVTVGPDQSGSTHSIKTGKAAHICAASPTGPRYDMSQTTAERRHINNGIWLCGACADLIDKNQGAGYPAEHVRKWKKDHEKLILDCLEGGKRLTFQFLEAPVDQKAAREMLLRLADRAALYRPYTHENARHVLKSLEQLREDMVNIAARSDPESEVTTVADSIARACRHYMNTVPAQPDLQELEYSLGAFRKIVGLNVGLLARHYKLTIPADLEDIVPR